MSKSCHALVHTTFSRQAGKGSAAQSRDVDLALAVMCAIQIPGERVPTKTIAEVTGMSHSAPFYIEKRALRKLRHRLREMKLALVA